MRFLPLGCLALSLAACGSEPRRIVDIGEVVGRWHVTLTEPPTCGRNNPAPAIDLDLTVLGRTEADTLALIGRWGLAPLVNPSLDLAGRLDLTTGEFHADLTGASPTSVARLEGTVGLGDGLNGTLTDPALGADPILGAGSCTYAAVGQH